MHNISLYSSHEPYEPFKTTLRVNIPMINSSHSYKYYHSFFSASEIGSMKVPQCIIQQLSNNIQKKNALSYYKEYRE